jgi:S-adenosylmethionine:tRNA-ribosyltransferase-isomerase (queuine synthetase)
VTTWNALLKSGEDKTLVDLFNTTDNVLQKVKQIKAEEIQKIFSANNPNGFMIDVWVTDISILDQLQKGVLYGFDNSDYVKDRLIAKRTKLQELIGKTSSEIRQLDSTKKIVENIMAGKTTSSSSLIFDGSNISRQLIELTEKLLSYEEELRFTNAVQVLQSFSKFRKPAGPNLYKWLLLGLISGLSVAYLTALFRSVNQKLKTRAKLQALSS